MLETLQRQHNETYQLDSGHDVRDFLITSPLVAGVIGQSALPAGSGETLFLSQDEHGLGMSLFLDGELLERVERSDPLSGLWRDQGARGHQPFQLHGVQCRP